MGTETEEWEASPAECEQGFLEGCLPDLIVQIGRDGMVLQILAGESVSMKTGKSLEEGLPPELATQFRGAVDQTLTTGQAQTFELQCPHVNPPEYKEARLMPCAGESVLVVIRNVTESRMLRLQAEQKQKQMEAALERIQQRSFLTSLAGGIAHEVNQPLNAIKVASDIILFWSRADRPLPPEKVLEYVETISEQATRIDSIIRHMRDLIKSQSASEKGHCLFHEAVWRAMTLLSKQLENHGIKVETVLEEQMRYVPLTTVQAEQIIINLVSNAMEALDHCARRHKMVRLSLTWDNEILLFRVADNGPGIDKTLQEEIFTPFFSTKKKDASLGLGLSLVRSMIEAAGGQVRVGSSPGNGAEFFLSIPGSEAPAAIREE
ncbi:MAG TPA: ATP-binding protein [Patescibacteria group bacterium]|nr:ATP-binding protein [Patescibacteria group bacterium]